MQVVDSVSPFIWRSSAKQTTSSIIPSVSHITLISSTVVLSNHIVPEIQEESKDYMSVDSAFPDSGHGHSRAALSPSKFKKKTTLFTDLYKVNSVLYQGIAKIKR